MSREEFEGKREYLKEYILSVTVDELHPHIESFFELPDYELEPVWKDCETNGDLIGKIIIECSKALNNAV